MTTLAEWESLDAIEQIRLQIRQLTKYHNELAGLPDDPKERLRIADDIFHPGRIAPRIPTNTHHN